MTVLPVVLPTVLPNLLAANWRSTISIETSSRVSVVPGRIPQAEERRQLNSRPTRTMSVTVTGMDQEGATELWQNVQAIADRRTVLPLYADQALTSASSSGQFVNVATGLYRFFPGARFVIFTQSQFGSVNVEYRRISAVSPTQLDLGAVGIDQLQAVHPIDSYIFPLLDIEIDLEGSQGVLETDECFEVQFSATEVIGPSALPYLEVGLPAGFPTYLGYPILTLKPDWSSDVNASVVRAGQKFDLGRGNVVAKLGARPQMQYDGQLMGPDRASAWDTLRFFESRAGRLRPWWLIAPHTLFELEDIQTTHVDISAVGNLADIDAFLDWVTLLVSDGSYIIRGIDDVTDQGGGIWRIVFDTTITAPALDDIVLVTSAHLVRQQEDSFTETWSTDGVAVFKFSAVDLLEEGPVSIAGLELTPFDLGPLADIPDLYLWASAQGNIWADNDGGGFSPTDPSKTFPEVVQGENDIDFVFDSRQGQFDPSLTEPYLERVGSNGAPRSARFSKQHLNAGQPTNYHFGVDVDVGWLLRNSQGKFWDDTDGMTVFLVGRFGGPAFDTQPQQHLLRVGVFEWKQDILNGGVVKFFAVADAAVPAANIAYDGAFDSQLRIWAVRWDPGVDADLYESGGTPLASAATPAASLSAVARDANVMVYHGNTFGPGDGKPQEIDTNLDRQCMTDDFLIYKRALDVAEMNVVGNWLAEKYSAAGVIWNTVP